MEQEKGTEHTEENGAERGENTRPLLDKGTTRRKRKGERGTGTGRQERKNSEVEEDRTVNQTSWALTSRQQQYSNNKK